MNETPDHPFFQDETPDHLFSNGPYLDVAVPKHLREIVPVNASALLREWESMLDPLAALRMAAKEEGRGEWLIDKWFVIPGWNTLALLQEARTDVDVIGVFTDPRAGIVRDARLGLEKRFRGSAIEDPDALSNSALPILLGFAVVASLIFNVGQASVALRLRQRAAIRERREKEREE